MKSRDICLLLTACLALTFTMPARAATIRREGESADKSNVQRNPDWYDKVDEAELSGGAWISHWSSDTPGTVTYRLKVEEQGDYTLWVRANPVQARLQFRVDQGDWREVPVDKAATKKNVALDEAEDIRYIGWIQAGAVELAEGNHNLSFRMEKVRTFHHGAIDVFVLTTEPFDPAEARIEREDEQEGEGFGPDVSVVGDDGYWAFEVYEDPFNGTCMLDLRSMNEEESGSEGFIRRDDAGTGFVRGDGQPIRFWSTTTSNIDDMLGEEMDTHCRWLAKLGVNMVRISAGLTPTGEEARLNEVDETRIDRLHRFIAAAKRAGLYVTISTYSSLYTVPVSWGLQGYTGEEQAWGLIFCNEQVKAAYRSWMLILLTMRNPYTGRSIAQDPTVAVLEIGSWDSLLFWTFNDIPDTQRAKLGVQFGNWAARKYGSLSDALAAWENTTLPGDQGMLGIFRFYDMPDMLQFDRGGEGVRKRDQLRFLADAERDFYDEMERYFKQDLGCQQLTIANNWHAAIEDVMGDTERWAKAASPIIAHQKSVGGLHTGEYSTFRIDPGDLYVSRSALHNPLSLPTNVKQIAGQPYFINSVQWTPPNLYRAEGPFLGAAYMSVTGVDTMCWSSNQDVRWQQDPRWRIWRRTEGPGGFGLYKGVGNTPDQAGMFPANAILWRRGYLERGKVAVHEERPLKWIFQLRVPLISQGGTLERSRDLQGLSGGRGRMEDVSRLAFLTGPVEMVLDGDADNSYMADLSSLVDAEAQTVRSSTEQVEWNWGRGICRVQAPRAVGVAGFLQEAGGRFDLGDVTIESRNQYAAISVVSMDGKPISDSQKVLVQVGTLVRPTGWAERPTTLVEDGQVVEGLEIVRTGYPPYMVADTRVKLRVRSEAVSRAMRLDTNGYAVQSVPVLRKDGWAELDLPRKTMHLVLE